MNSTPSLRDCLRAFVLAAGSFSAHAANVVDVAPASLAVYLSSHPQVAVEFTSPDARCYYCRLGGEATFKQVAAGFGSDVAFIRVQWVPWWVIPAEIRSLGVGGVPMHQVFKQGRSVHLLSGAIQDPAAYATELRGLFPGALAAPAKPDAASTPASRVPAARPVAPAPAGPVLVASPAEGASPVVDCSQYMQITNRDDIPWHIDGADATFCGQTAIGFYPADFSSGVAAFKQGRLVGLRDYAVPPVYATWGGGKTPLGEVVHSGRTGARGELWWALLSQPSSGMRHVAVGQTTFTRVMAAQGRTDLRRAADLALGRIPLPYPATPQASYRFVDATPVTSRGYLGGKGYVTPGRVVRADLDVATLDPIHGEMRFELEIEGVAHSLVLPLKRAVLEASTPKQVLRGGDMNRLVSGRATEGGVVADCLETPDSQVRVPCAFHLEGSPPGSNARYAAEGYFFGPQSDFVVVSFTYYDLWFTGDNGPRSNGSSSGLIVFKAR